MTIHDVRTRIYELSQQAVAEYNKWSKPSVSDLQKAISQLPKEFCRKQVKTNFRQFKIVGENYQQLKDWLPWPGVDGSFSSHGLAWMGV